jgi:hypothetical protein
MRLPVCLSATATRLLMGVLVGLASTAMGCGSRSVGLTQRSTGPELREEQVYRSLLERLDDDHDGSVSLAEWHNHGGKASMFEFYDFNRDQRLDLGELAQLFRSADPLLHERALE